MKYAQIQKMAISSWRNRPLLKSFYYVVSMSALGMLWATMLWRRCFFLVLVSLVYHASKQEKRRLRTIEHPTLIPTIAPRDRPDDDPEYLVVHERESMSMMATCGSENVVSRAMPPSET